MTATHVTRRRARIALAAAGLATALALTGCSGGSGSDDSAGGTPTPSTSASPGSPGDTGGGSGTSGGKAGKLEGSWLATTKGKAVVLMINGRQVALYETNGTLCRGTAGDEAGMQMIHLSCPDGGKNRKTGMVDSVNSASLKVTWQGGLGTETYQKAEGSGLPSGLPTTGLGS
ncbi:hypothetical protein ABZ845_21005 [Streptomyces sp. NPDC047022]|uniref:hypothetical protein n=1 Tax=Streptomyces sp. NPDC047022 TaxID=3155737 RepID=UPI0034098FD2